MSKFHCLVVDPPWRMNDKLTMSDVKRGAASHYDTLSDEELMKLDVDKLAANDSVLVLWVPSSKLQSGLDVVKAWGFRQTQTFVWVKVKKKPLDSLRKAAMTLIKNPLSLRESLRDIISGFDINNIVTMNLGRWFRQTHEIALIGVRGKIYSRLQNKSQRSVLFDINLKHSSKPEGLQDRLEMMLPLSRGNKHLELFARRDRSGVTCVGFECPSTAGEDIRDSIDRLIKN